MGGGARVGKHGSPVRFSARESHASDPRASQATFANHEEQRQHSISLLTRLMEDGPQELERLCENLLPEEDLSETEDDTKPTEEKMAPEVEEAKEASNKEEEEE